MSELRGFVGHERIWPRFVSEKCLFLGPVKVESRVVLVRKLFGASRKGDQPGVWVFQGFQRLGIGSGFWELLRVL